MIYQDWNIVPLAIGALTPVWDDTRTVVDFKWRFANEATGAMFGVDAADLVGARLLEVVPSLHGHDIFDYMASLVSGPDDDTGIFATTPTPGSKILNRRFLANFRTHDGVLICTLQDISEIARARDTAQDQVQLFEGACDHAVQGVVLSDRTGNLIYANEAFANLVGYDVDTLLSINVKDFVHQDEFDTDRAIAQQLLTGTVTQNIRNKRYIRADGSEIHVSVALSIVHTLLDGEPLYIGHVRDITAERAQDEALRDALSAAEEAADLKSQFLANMSHEIRTPLNGIVGMAQILDHSALSPDQAEHLAVLKESSHTLMALLNDILDLSKIEAGKLDISPVTADLRHKLSRVFKVHEMAAQEKGLNFKAVIHPSVPSRLMFDPIRIRQCLDNLIANALKFTAEGDIIITITCGPEEDGLHTLTAHVCDTGPGIPPEKQATIFEAFQQMDGSITRNHGGSGLGLAITRQLAHLMGGELTVQSQTGRGSVFTLTFEAGALPGQAMSPDVQTTTITHQAGQLSDIHALVVDDNEINRRVARTLLSGHGMTTDEADNGITAIEKMSETVYDVILLDIHMPIMDGTKTFERMREMEAQLGRLPVIALTADAMSGDREKYLALGMDGYVSKPIDERDLVAEISRVLQIKAAA